MAWTHSLSYFFGGAILANALPHYISGVLGRPFQTPFAKPPGEGLSSSTVNVLWGLFNFAIAFVLIGRVGHFDLWATGHAVALGLGVFAMSLVHALAFGRFHGGNAPRA